MGAAKSGCDSVSFLVIANHANLFIFVDVVLVVVVVELSFTESKAGLALASSS